MPAQTASTPGMSSRGRCGDGWRRSSMAAPMAAIAAKNRFTYRHQRQDKYCVSTPPSSRPIAPPTPAIAPNTPNAFPRSLEPLKVVVRIESAEGASSAPNKPWQARAPTSMPKLVAAPPAAEAAAKPSSPIRKVTLRPSRPASLPPSSSRLPEVRA
jgi:hypothetical protein